MLNQQTLSAALDELGSRDKDVAEALKQVGYPLPRIRPAGFPTLLSTIVSQQISAEAARSIYQRLEKRLGEVCARSLLALTENDLRELGLSRRKVEYARGLASAMVQGHFDPDALNRMDDESAIDEIVALRGFGRWSAEIYLMFSLQRPDIFPADDLALQVALGRLKGLPDRPRPKQVREITMQWQPWRSAGALFLWHYYRGMPA